MKTHVVVLLVLAFVTVTASIGFFVKSSKNERLLALEQQKVKELQNKNKELSDTIESLKERFAKVTAQRSSSPSPGMTFQPSLFPQSPEVEVFSNLSKKKQKELLADRMDEYTEKMAENKASGVIAFLRMSFTENPEMRKKLSEMKEKLSEIYYDIERDKERMSDEEYQAELLAACSEVLKNQFDEEELKEITDRLPRALNAKIIKQDGMTIISSKDKSGKTNSTMSISVDSFSVHAKQNE